MSRASLRGRGRLVAATCASALTLSGLAALPAAAQDDLTWEAITFGQSVDLNFSANVLPGKVGLNTAVPDVPGTIEGEIFMESRGGKIAPGHDGLTFYQLDLDPREHNFLLEADVLVHQLGPETGANPNGQEGAGLMVRDVNGPPRQEPMLPGFEEYPAASNLAATTMMRYGPAPLVRTGVTEPWGTVGSSRSFDPWARNTACEVVTGVPIRMTLERTDEAFVMGASWAGADGSDCAYTSTRQGADLVQVQDAGSMHVGFFASRNAAVTFSDASLTLSPADSVPSPPAPEPVRALVVDNLSPEHSSTSDYEAAVRSTYAGRVTVVADGVTVVQDAPVAADEVAAFRTQLAEGTHQLSLTFTPTHGPDRRPVTRSWTVQVRELGAVDLVAAPGGTPDGAGTVEAPLDVQTALNFVAPGRAVVLQGGTYEIAQGLQVNPAYRGREDAPKTLTAAEDADVVIDAGYRDGITRGLLLEADHWHVTGFQVTRTMGNGLRVHGSHNVVEDMLFNFNRDSGFQMSSATVTTDTARWPSHNLVLNSESHDNRDLSDINADGFAAKLGVGPGNVFRGNVAHHNIDDGWDLYNRLNEGPNFPIVLEDNIAHSNGKLSDGDNRDGSTGVGFKLGGEGLPVEHVVRGNLAFDNNMDGFSDNFNPGRMVLDNNTAVDNVRYNWLLRSSPYFAPQEQSVLRNSLSVRVLFSRPEHPDALAADVDSTVYYYDRRTINDEGRVVRPSEFVSLRMPSRIDRTPDGDIVWGPYAQPRATSFLATSGTGGTHVGAVPPATGPGRPNEVRTTSAGRD